MIMQTCRRHPIARFYRDCPGCKRDLADTQDRNERAAVARRIVAQIAAIAPDTIQFVKPVDAGVVVVCRTTDSDEGEYEVMAWRPRAEWEIAQDTTEWPVGHYGQIPQFACAFATALEAVDEVDSAIAEAAACLAARLDELGIAPAA